MVDDAWILLVYSFMLKLSFSLQLTLAPGCLSFCWLLFQEYDVLASLPFSLLPAITEQDDLILSNI